MQQKQQNQILKEITKLTKQKQFTKAFLLGLPISHTLQRQMKQIEFQHFRKAPHPYQMFGKLPPTALINRSLPKQYSSIPQGQDAFTQRSGKKQFNVKYQSSLTNNLFSNANQDSLVREMAKYNHKVTGRSLQTNDIEGAQGGSLKSPAVKYKQKAQKLKLEGINNGFDKHEYEQNQYRQNIQNAIKFQHSNDMQIGRYISYKGHGHILNPQNKPNAKKQQHSNRGVNHQYGPQYSGQASLQPDLKMKHKDFESKDQNYKNLFSQIKSKEQNYDHFFDQLKRQEGYSPRHLNSNSSSKQDNMTSRKYNTVELQKDVQAIRQYQPKNFPKKSLQSQFRQEQGLGMSSILYQNDDAPKVNNQYAGFSPNIQQGKHVLTDLRKEQRAKQEFSRMIRKFNPTNLSTGIDSASLKTNLFY